MRAFALAALALLPVAGCDSAADGLLPVEGALVASVPPLYDRLPGDPVVVPAEVVVATTGTYDCANYRLVADVAARPGVQRVDVRGAVASEGCLRARGPASLAIALPAGAGAGYRVEVSGPGLPLATYVLVEEGGVYRLRTGVLYDAL